MTRRPPRRSVGLGQLVTPAASLAAMAGAWLGPVTPDERAALLTAAAAASTLAALRMPHHTVAATPHPSERDAGRAKVSSKEFSRGKTERVDDLAALIATW